MTPEALALKMRMPHFTPGSLTHDDPLTQVVVVGSMYVCFVCKDPNDL